MTSLGILVVVLQSIFSYEVPQDCWKKFLSRSLETLFLWLCLYQILTNLTSSVSGGLQTSCEDSYPDGCITNLILVWLLESSFIVLSICSFCVVDSSSTFSFRSPMTYWILCRLCHCHYLLIIMEISCMFLTISFIL